MLTGFRLCGEIQFVVVFGQQTGGDCGSSVDSMKIVKIDFTNGPPIQIRLVSACMLPRELD